MAARLVAIIAIVASHRRRAAAVLACAAAVAGLCLLRGSPDSATSTAAPLPSATPAPTRQVVARERPRASAGAVARLMTMRPSRLLIPELGVSAAIGAASVDNGVLTPPRKQSVVGAWAGSAALDAPRGEVTLAGHVNWTAMGPFAFARLAELRPGATVFTSDRKGKVTKWIVRKVGYRKKAAGVDPRAFQGARGPRTLALITCGGAFDSDAGSYESNVYAYATPA